mmetsp:Transcript_52070/g.121055  ORF Transcript_52070/g.121055 Transcript_52070/m.121055 type:complete len:532 (-) Transcript_52070:97-1692(-)
MYDELYPAPAVSWYPHADGLQGLNPSGLSYPEPQTTVAAEVMDTVASPLASPKTQVYMRSEYGRQSCDRNAMSFYTNAAGQGFSRTARVLDHCSSCSKGVANAVRASEGHCSSSWSKGSANAARAGDDHCSSSWSQGAAASFVRAGEDHDICSWSKGAVASARGEEHCSSSWSNAVRASEDQCNSSCSKGVVSSLVVNVDSALDLVPTDGFGPHHFCATAYYPGELQEDIDARKTAPVKANPSSTSPSLENCVLHKRVTVPYNSKHQFVMVEVYEADQLGDSLIGKATVPVADPNLASTSPWPLIRNGLPNGTLTLNVQLPDAQSTAASSQTSWHEHDSPAESQALAPDTELGSSGHSNCPRELQAPPRERQAALLEGLCTQPDSRCAGFAEGDLRSSHSYVPPEAMGQREAGWEEAARARSHSYTPAACCDLGRSSVPYTPAARCSLGACTASAPRVLPPPAPLKSRSLGSVCLPPPVACGLGVARCPPSWLAAPPTLAAPAGLQLRSACPTTLQQPMMWRHPRASYRWC